MHLSSTKDATRLPGMNVMQQRDRFAAFMRDFNDERPHEALAKKRPVHTTVCRNSPIRCMIATFSSPPAGASAGIGKKINVSIVLAGQRLGIKEVDEGIWLVSFMSCDDGFIDLEQKPWQTLDNPFGPRSSPLS